MNKLSSVILLICAVLPGCIPQGNHSAIINPIHPGYFADPSIIKRADTFFIYSTIDPWGSNELNVMVSTDFKNWEQKHLNWPTKKECASPTSWSAMVWAPSVVKASNGMYYMYVSVGSEIWAGISKNPLGPWQNAIPDGSPLINTQKYPGYHMIDAEVFIDDDNQAYLYWGSGLEWVNGRCFMVRLKKDMVTFDGEPTDLTPPNYFEGPFMLKRNGTYYLMYSDGKAIDHTYKVRYSTGKTPYGPWKEGLNSPILSTSADSTTYGPGHHTVFMENGQYYILYHRLAYPLKKDSVLRQLCIDSLNFDHQGNIIRIKPKGVAVFGKK